MVILKNWAVCHDDNPWIAPELETYRLIGNVYGHPRFNDGDSVRTSSIGEVEEGDGCKIVHTRNTNYHLYKEDVSKEYEDMFPDAYDRLSLVFNA